MSTAAQSRAWNGPAIFTLGFRPFFFFGALYAAVLVTIWVPWFFGYIEVPSALSPVVWHAHELLFGYVAAIVAGFLLTSVPNWTGRLPVVGWPLATLFAFWLMGRLVLAFSANLPPLAVALLTLVFPVALVVVIGREIMSGENWRNLKILVVFGVFIGAQALFHYEFWRYGDVEYADRLAIGTIVMLLSIVGGRVVPSFTTNWLRRLGPGPLPVPFGRYDKLVMVVGALALVGWVLRAKMSDNLAVGAGAVLMLAGVLHFVRLGRWQVLRTLKAPIVTVLHVGYGFVPVGFLLSGYAMVFDQFEVATAGVHAWTVGAVGMMTLAVMTRATRGHSGQELTAPPTTVAIYAAVFVAAIARICAALSPEYSTMLMSVAGIGWVLAFLGFVVIYGPMLWRRRRA